MKRSLVTSASRGVANNVISRNRKPFYVVIMNAAYTECCVGRTLVQPCADFIESAAARPAQVSSWTWPQDELRIVTDGLVL